MAAQPRHGKIHEGADFRHREPALRRNHMHGQRRRLIAGKNYLEFTVPHLLCDLI
jgi:hypothetical protein